MDEDIIIKSVALYKDGKQKWIFNEKVSRDYVAGMIIATEECLQGLRKEDFSHFYFSIQRADRKNTDHVFEATNLSLDFKIWKENFFELFSREDKYSFRYVSLISGKSLYLFFRKKKLLERFVGGFRDVCYSYRLNLNEFSIEYRQANGEKLLDLYDMTTENTDPLIASEFIKPIIPGIFDEESDEEGDSSPSDDAENYHVLDDN
jgi:hypothetical protein